MSENDFGVHELIISNRELANLIRIHDSDIAALKARVEHALKQSERLEVMVHQIGDDVSSVRSEVTKKVNEMQIAVLNHIQNDERAQNKILRMLLWAAFTNGAAIVVWFSISWIESGMPWPIFPWL